MRQRKHLHILIKIFQKAIAYPLGFIGLGIVVTGVLIEGLAEMIMSEGEGKQ